MMTEFELNDFLELAEKKRKITWSEIESFFGEGFIETEDFDKILYKLDKENIKVINDSINKWHIKVIDTEKITNEKIQCFLYNLIFQKNIGDIFSLSNIKDDFFQKYNTILTDEHIESVLKYVNKEIAIKKIEARLLNDIIVLYPTQCEIESFCYRQLFNKKIGDSIIFEEIRNDFLQKYKCVPEYLSAILYNTVTNHSHIINSDVKRTDKEFIFIPKENNNFSSKYSTQPYYNPYRRKRWGSDLLDYCL